MIAAATVLAGAVGAVLRFLVAGVVDAEVRARISGAFPWGIVVVNVTGSFVLGGVAGLVLFGGAAESWQVIVGTGLCGGYTTFSTASVDTVQLIRSGRYATAAANSIGSLVASVASCAAGVAFAAVMT